jgi:hypothetical protein
VIVGMPMISVVCMVMIVVVIVSMVGGMEGVDDAAGSEE